MLLRLLPTPTATQANPPTILFTLPLQTQPYTARSLPLPPNLLAHRSVCLQEDIECTNVLLGDKASWITGIIDDVTFSLVAQTVTVNYIDGTKSTYSIEESCREMLYRVCKEVELSFAPAPSPQPSPPRSRSSSNESMASSSSLRRSTSNLLLSFLSPLLPSSSSASLANRIPPARIHRRQARSILVDTFRRFVLPTLKAELPAAYLPWTIASEMKRRLADFEALRSEVDGILAETGVQKSPRAPLRRYRTISSDGDCSSDDESSSVHPCASSSSLLTPATSVYSDVDNLPTPQSFLLSIPPAHALPSSHQPSYTVLLQRLTQIASRLHAIKRLSAKYEKEENKRVWLETLERGQAGEKALRRAFSNGELSGEVLKAAGVASGPSKRTNLWRSWTMADQERETYNQAVHPAMVDSESEAEPEMISDEEDIEMIEELSPVTPTAPLFAHRAIAVRLPNLDTCYEETADSHSTDREASISDDDEDSLPSLCMSSSSESLSSGEWDDTDEVRTPSPPPLSPENDTENKLHQSSMLPSPAKDGFDWSARTMGKTPRPQSRMGYSQVTEVQIVTVSP